MKPLTFGAFSLRQAAWVAEIQRQSRTPAPVNNYNIARDGRSSVFSGKQYPPRKIRLTLKTNPGFEFTEVRRETIYKIFSPGELLPDPITEIPGVHRLTVTDNDGSGGDRYIECSVVAIHERKGKNNEIYVDLESHGPRDWRQETTVTRAHTITGTAGTWDWTFNYGGSVSSDPRIQITPKQALPNTNPYRIWLAPAYKLLFSASNYPVDVANGGLDTRIATTNFDSATADDVRVFVDGVLTDFYPGNWDTNGSRVWINLDFEVSPEMETFSAFNIGDDILEIDSTFVYNSRILPESGLLIVDSGSGNYEVVSYEGHSNNNTDPQQFFITGRGLRGSTEQNHAAKVAVWWIQHDIFLEYGLAGSTPYPSDPDKAPAFDINTSSNSQWIYTTFGSGLPINISDNTGRFIFNQGSLMEPYTGVNNAGDTSPYDVIGIKQIEPNPVSLDFVSDWRQIFPLGMLILSVSGSRFAGSSSNQANWWNKIQTGFDGQSWTEWYDIAAPGLTGTWTPFSNSAGVPGVGTLSIAPTHLRLAFRTDPDGNILSEIDSVDVGFDIFQLGGAFISPELNNYRLAGRLQMFSDSGRKILLQEIRLDLTTGLNDVNEIDTLNGTFFNTTDRINLYGGMNRNPTRSRWFPLVPESDAYLRWIDDTGAPVEIDIDFVYNNWETQ